MFKKLFGFGKKEEDEPEIVEEEVVEADESESAQESDSDESVEELQEEPVVDMVIEEPSVETVIEDEPIVVVEEPVEEVVEETVEAVADEPAPQMKSFFGKLMDVFGEDHQRELFWLGSLVIGLSLMALAGAIRSEPEGPPPKRLPLPGETPLNQ